MKTLDRSAEIVTFPVDDAHLMTLAGIAYGAAEKIPSYLSKASLLAGEWSLVWQPGTQADPDNFAFLALNKTAKTAVLAIRGTYPNPLSPIYWENGQQDSPFGTMAKWQGSQTAKISKGTNTGYCNLVALTNDAGQTIADAIAGLDADISVSVTGHSLGGTLTPVLALKLAEDDPQREIYSVSFAGMTPGNAAFAELCGPNGALKGRTKRVFNTLDSVSFGWNNVLATRNFYQPAPKGGWLVKIFLVIAWFRLRFGGYGFAGIGADAPLTGSVKNPNQKHGLISYVLENLHQHMPDTYLKLLGAPALPFNILFGTTTSEKPNVRDHSAVNAGLPVYHI